MASKYSIKCLKCKFVPRTACVPLRRERRYLSYGPEHPAQALITPSNITRLGTRNICPFSVGLMSAHSERSMIQFILIIMDSPLSDRLSTRIHKMPSTSSAIALHVPFRSQNTVDAKYVCPRGGLQKAFGSVLTRANHRVINRRESLAHNLPIYCGIHRPTKVLRLHPWA